MSILILLVLFNGKPTVTSIEFEDNAACLKALNSSLSLEDSSTKIKARCVSK